MSVRLGSPVAVGSRNRQNVDRSRTAAVRLALRKEEAAAALGISDESFDRYVRPHVPVVRCGSLRMYPIVGLEAWLEEQASTPLEDVS